MDIGNHFDNQGRPSKNNSLEAYRSAVCINPWGLIETWILPHAGIVEPKRFFDLSITPGVIFKQLKTTPLTVKSNFIYFLKKMLENYLMVFFSKSF